jgi:hypothetical protein
VWLKLYSSRISGARQTGGIGAVYKGFFSFLSVMSMIVKWGREWAGMKGKQKKTKTKNKRLFSSWLRPERLFLSFCLCHYGTSAV